MSIEMFIEEVLYPGQNKLKVKGEVITTLIVDAELDPIKCEFDNGGCVILNTKDYDYITLTEKNLEVLLILLEKAEKKYDKIFKKLKKNDTDRI